MTATATLEGTLNGLQNEDAPSLGDFAPQDKPYWVGGIIRAAYQSGENPETGQPYEFRTEDKPSKSGSNRNLSIVGQAFKQDGSAYNVSGRITYNPANVTPEGLRANAAALKKVNGNISKLATKEEKARAMQIGKLGQLEVAVQKATNNPQFRLTLNGNGGFDVTPLFDVAVDFEMRRNDRGYSQIERVGTAGTHKGTRR